MVDIISEKEAEADFKKYEVVLKCKVKAVVYAKDEQEAIEQSKLNKTEKEFEWDTAETIREISDDETRNVIKNIVGSFKEALSDLQFCTGCETYKPKTEFKKCKKSYGYADLCKECAYDADL